MSDQELENQFWDKLDWDWELSDQVRLQLWDQLWWLLWDHLRNHLRDQLQIHFVNSCGS